MRPTGCRNSFAFFAKGWIDRGALPLYNQQHGTLRSAHRFAVLALWATLLFPLPLVASKNFVKPVAKSAINYPAHDFHRDAQVAIAADPYDTPEKAKIFSVDFAAHGFLPDFLSSSPMTATSRSPSPTWRSR